LEKHGKIRIKMRIKIRMKKNLGRLVRAAVLG
jgi:hypothetical protein